MAAARIADINDRVKALQQIKADYPQTVISYDIDHAILNTVSRNADTLDKVLAVQREVIDSAKTEDSFALMADAANLILAHPNVDKFSKPSIIKAIQGYKTEAMQLLAKPGFMEPLLELTPEGLHRQFVISYRTAFDMPLAKAQLMNGNGQAALGTLNEYKRFGSLNADYYNTLGETYLALKRDREALDAFLSCTRVSTRSVVSNARNTVGSSRVAIAKAKNVYIKIYGKEDGFDVELERYQAELPFHTPSFVAPAEWKGKTVLAELFTGAGCGPCVAADYAFDGLIETYPAQYLAILEYHLSIPLPDPIMNPTTQMRQNYYKGVLKGTPTAIVDGATVVPTGGGAADAIESFTRLKNAIDPLLGSETKLTITAKASIDGDMVQVDCEFSDVIEGADYNVALVQTEERYKGENGILFHKMVVRDMETLKPVNKVSAILNIPESEKATDAYLTKYESTGRKKKFPVKHNLIDRGKLRVVVFVQDKGTRQVHNAVVAPVLPKL
jgi:hypothetical protein